MKKLLKSVHIYRSYRQNKPGGPFFWNTRYTCPLTRVSLFGSPVSHTLGARGKNMQNFAYFQRVFLPLRTWRIVPYDLLYIVLYVEKSGNLVLNHGHVVSLGLPTVPYFRDLPYFGVCTPCPDLGLSKTQNVPYFRYSHTLACLLHQLTLIQWITYYQTFSLALRYYQIQFRLGLRPDPTGSIRRSQTP